MSNVLKQVLSILPKDVAFAVFSEENRRYITNFASSDGMLLLSAQGATFYTDSRYLVAAKQEILPEIRVLPADLPYVRLLDRDLPDSVATVYFEEDHLTYGQFCRLREALRSSVGLEGKQEILRSLRRVKSETEIARIVRAQQMTDAAFSHVCDFIAHRWRAESLSERRVAAELEYAMKLGGSAAPSFDTIVASGENGAKPHAVPSDRILRDGDLVTMDFGAVYEGYHSDMTRTVAIGSVSDPRRAVYDTVLLAQTTALSNLRAGMSGQEIDALARDVIARAGYADAFGHSLGHGIGLDIHESPNFSPKNGDPIPAGCVMSVEPGIYLEGNCGVRIEDMVVVTETGCENLTASPKELLIL